MGCVATSGTAASKDPKYPSAFHPKEERPRNKRDRSPQTGSKLFLGHDPAPVVGWPCRREYDAHVCQVLVRFFVSSGLIFPPAS